MILDADGTPRRRHLGWDVEPIEIRPPAALSAEEREEADERRRVLPSIDPGRPEL